MSATTDVIARDQSVLLHAMLPYGTERRFVLASGEGCRVRDVAGREYLDMHAGAWLCQVGHGRSELARIAAAQMERLAHFTTMWDYSNEPAVALAEKLVALAPPGITRAMFTSTGSEGDEVALKMSRMYHARRGEPDRTVVLALRGAYHGDGAGGTALAGGSDDGSVISLTPPWPYHPELHDGQNPTDFCVAELERVIAETGAERIASMFGEPVMGPAGMIPLPDDYWPRMTEILHAHGILYVADEVVTAFGRSGHWFACERYDVRPDIIVTAKGIASGYMPLGAVLVTEAVTETLSGNDGFPVGSSYGGHAAACAVALGSIDIIEREGLVENARVVGGYTLSALHEALDEIPVVGNIRGLGLMIGIELVGDRETRAPLPPGPDLGAMIRDEHGVIVGYGRGSIHLTPPLIATHEDADEAVAATAAVLARVRPDGSLS